MRDTIKKAIKDFTAGKPLPDYRTAIPGTGIVILRDERWSWFNWEASHGSSPGDTWWTYKVYNKETPDEIKDYGVIRHKPAACPKTRDGAAIKSIRPDGTVNPWGNCDACEYFKDEHEGGPACAEPSQDNYISTDQGSLPGCSTCAYPYGSDQCGSCGFNTAKAFPYTPGQCEWFQESGTDV